MKKFEITHIGTPWELGVDVRVSWAGGEPELHYVQLTSFCLDENGGYDMRAVKKEVFQHMSSIWRPQL